MSIVNNRKTHYNMCMFNSPSVPDMIVQETPPYKAPEPTQTEPTTIEWPEMPEYEAPEIPAPAPVIAPPQDSAEFAYPRGDKAEGPGRTAGRGGNAMGKKGTKALRIPLEIKGDPSTGLQIPSNTPAAKPKA